MYLIAFFILLITFAASLSNLNRKIYYFFICFLFIFLGGFRWSVGTDWNTYISYFYNNSSFNDFINGDIKEFAYALSAFIFKSISDNYTYFLLFQSTIAASIFLFFLYTYSNGSILAVLLFFLNSIGNIYFVRQTIASAFFLLALHFFLKQKLGRSLFYQLIGVGFHYTSALLSFIFILSSRKIFYLGIFFFSLIFIFFNDYISNYFLFKISLYFSSGETDEFFSENYGGLTPIKLIWCLYLFFILYLCRLFSVYSSRDNAFSVHFFGVYTLLFILGIAIPQLNRLTQYFSVFEQIILSLIVAKINGWLKVFFVLFVLILYFVKYHFRISAWPEETDVFNTIFSGFF